MADEPVERPQVGVDDGHVGAPPARGRRDLAPDEAGADDDDPVRDIERRAQRLRVIQRPEVVHVVASGDRQPVRRGAGRDDDGVGPQPMAVVEYHRPITGLERRRGPAEHQVHVLRRSVVDGQQPDPGRVRLGRGEQILDNGGRS